MARTVKLAAVQMDANPAPTAERLARAERLVAAAAEAGAQLVVLPEIFNTGYAYTDENFDRAETLADPTAQWMKETAARRNIHLAGSLMLLDQGDVYNALLLFAPDGRMWRYDKNYPWAWERTYFRGSRRITVAGTDLGDVGMMICWDSGHEALWRRYAGQVDLMIVSSCPPDVTEPTYYLPGGDTLTLDDLGPVMAPLKGTGRWLFGESINRQAAWLQVPTVVTVGSGRIRTAIPNGVATLLGMVPLAPRLARYLPRANGLEMACDIVPGCRVVNAGGQVLAQVEPGAGDGFTLAEVQLADHKPLPSKPQPAICLPRIAYISSDLMMPLLSIPAYRKGVARVWRQRGNQTAAPSRAWLWISLMMAVTIGLGILFGRVLRRR